MLPLKRSLWGPLAQKHHHSVAHFRASSVCRTPGETRKTHDWVAVLAVCGEPLSAGEVP
jgi:hypothetical protein